MSSDAVGLGVPLKVKPAAAAASNPSSVPEVVGRKSTPLSR